MSKRIAFVDGNLHSKEYINPNGKSSPDAVNKIPEVGESDIIFERVSAIGDYAIGDKFKQSHYNHPNIKRGKFPNKAFGSITLETQSLMWTAGTDERLDKLIDLNTLVGAERKHCILVKRID